MASLNIAIIVGSTRPGRYGAAVAAWVYEQASGRADARYEVIDLERTKLPLLDESVPALLGQYEHQHTRDWAATVARFDGFVFVTPEYNHSTSPALLNALDYVYGEWNNKAAAFVSYGTSYGVRAVEHLRGVVGELQMADIRNQVRLQLPGNFPDRVFTPSPEHHQQAADLFDQLERWAGALRAVRS
ncbi:NADPH-dependent FMN reductase [Curtobacterium sp. ME26]|uniref:NADPH-dependent FMN reductase n=1 Tax=Curtobacterium sp. ME26 TaxID=2744254 RepID=UPI0015F5625D|nr:NADPH-dependent FMN reductase [Curtobacterium sp. ME26]